MRLAGFVVLAGLCCTCVAATDPALDELKLSLVGLRAKADMPSKARGATPELTVLKHQLRDWVESRFLPAKDPDELKSRLETIRLVTDSNR